MNEVPAIHKLFLNIKGLCGLVLCKVFLVFMNILKKPKRINFITPHSSELNFAGIYRIVFDNGSFYIGSSKKLNIRKNCYHSAINHPVFKDNKAINECIDVCKFVTFEVVERISKISSLRKRETFYLQKEKDNPLLLNRAKTGYSNKGVKWRTEDRINFRAKSKELFRTGALKPKGYQYIMKPVIILDLSGNEIAKFPTQKAAAEYLKCDNSVIAGRLKGKNKLGKPYRGLYNFKYADAV